MTPAGQKKTHRQTSPTTNLIHIAWVSIPTTPEKKQTIAFKFAEQVGSQMGDGKIPAKYHRHLSVFSEEASH